MTGFAGGAFVIAAPAYTAETAEIRSIFINIYNFVNNR